MSSNAPQNLANHVRYDPLFHFFLLPVFLISLIVSVAMLANHRDWHRLWLVVFVLGLAVAVFKIRLYALKVQDRVIRLEERLRLAALLPESERAQIPKLSEKQLVALRFASDEELPALAKRAWSENLQPADIKKAIRNWRPDYWRV
jgi:hypothetical protein